MEKALSVFFPSTRCTPFPLSLSHGPACLSLPTQTLCDETDCPATFLVVRGRGERGGRDGGDVPDAAFAGLSLCLNEGERREGQEAGRRAKKQQAGLLTVRLPPPPTHSERERTVLTATTPPPHPKSSPACSIIDDLPTCLLPFSPTRRPQHQDPQTLTQPD